MFTNAVELGIKPEGEKYILKDNSTNHFPDIIMEKPTNLPDFLETWEMIYLWLFGSWNNIQDWDYIPIKIEAIIASFFLILIMTNIFVALMT